MNTLRKNIIFLFALQGTNYLLPLITVPYLVRVLGPENYGRIAFAQAFIQYFVLLTDYGFNLSATRSIALVRDDPAKLSSLFSAVMIIKVTLMTFGFILLLLIVRFIPIFNRDWYLYVLVYLSVVGNVLFPIWLFQGLERMHYITAFTILARILIIIAIFTLVHRRNDYQLAAGLQASSLVIAGFLSLVILPHLVKVRLHWPGIAQIRQTTTDGWHVFLSTAAISLYTSSNIFFIGLLTNLTAVGYFAAAEKLIKAVQGLISPVSQAVYPHIASLSTRSHEAALVFVGKLLRLQGAATFLFSILLFLLAKQAVDILLGDQFQESVQLVEWMAALPFVIGLSNVLGIQVMFIFGLDAIVSRIVIVLGFVNVGLVIILIEIYGVIGAAISLVIIETMVTISYAWFVNRSGLLRKIIFIKTD